MRETRSDCWSTGAVVVLILLTVPILGGMQCRSGPDQGRAAVPKDQTGVTTPGAVPFRNVVGGGADFTGDEACTTCHEDEWRGFQDHGMAQSYYALTDSNAVEDFSGTTVIQTSDGFFYRAVNKNGKFIQEEFRVDENGVKTHVLERPMEFVMGSGTAARTYMTTERGRLYQLPLTWYTQVQRWDLSPGYELGNKRFGRLVPDGCMACHNSYPESVPYAEGKYTAVPMGIGCERCHGPGSLHVDERLASEEAPGEYDDTIVNPDVLTFEREMDVCQQCHLSASVSILRPGRDYFDFRPSQSLDDHVALFAAEGKGEPAGIGVISHADRMKQSACFLGSRNSDEPLTCTTCHDPHEGFRDDGPQYFSATCIRCHELESLGARVSTAQLAEHVPEADCASCHMKKVASGEAPHASFTDHWIRVFENHEPPEPVVAHDAVRLRAYYNRDQSGDDAEVFRGMAYIIYGRQHADEAAVERGIEMLAGALRNARDNDEAVSLLGWAYLNTGQVELAIPLLEEAVQANPDIPERLNALAQAYEQLGRDSEKIERLYQRALSIQPALADVRVNFGRFLEVGGNIEAALSEYERAVEEMPSLAVAHYNRGTALLRLGNSGEAKASLERAIELDPGYAEAFSNLGMLYASQGQLEDAGKAFRRAVDANPKSAVAFGNLGAFYLNNADPGRAIVTLERAVDLDETYVDALANLALAYLQANRSADAREAATKALGIDASNALAQQVLGAL